MRFLIQRVKHASVTVDDRVSGQIDQGFLVLIGVCEGDTEQTADKMVHKLCGLRIFADVEGRIHRSLADGGGGLLRVSQFTLYADCKKGFRPSFFRSGDPARAEQLYDYIVARCREQISNVQTGEFGADMAVELLNDGPFTILLDSDEIGA